MSHFKPAFAVFGPPTCMMVAHACRGFGYIGIGCIFAIAALGIICCWPFLLRGTR